MKVLPAALVLLLALAPVAGAFGAPASAPATGADVPLDHTDAPLDPANDSAHVLDIAPSNVSRSAVRSKTVELRPALAFDTNETDRHVATRAMVRRINASGDTPTRSKRILDELNTLEREAINLQSRQRELIEAYAAEDISTRAFLERLGRLDAVARALDERRRALGTLAGETPGLSVDSRIADLSREFDVLRGPVRERVTSVLRGRAASTRFYVAVGNRSVVLATVADGRYVRESYRGDVRGGDGGITPETALNVTASSYPLIWTTKQNNTQVVGSGRSYIVDVPHRQGHLTAFVDGGSKRVFKEIQTRPVDTMGTGPAASATRDGLRLTVNRSHPGSPLRIALSDADTGRPVDANITVGARSEERSDLVGRTGPDGVVWTLVPGERFSVTAIRGNSVVVLTVDPTDPPMLSRGGDVNDTTAALGEGS